MGLPFPAALYSEKYAERTLRSVSVGDRRGVSPEPVPRAASGQGAGTSAVAAASISLAPESMPQGFAPGEYPRRWQRLRALMKERNLDCVIAPNGGDDEPSDVMYLRATGGTWVVFPYDGKVRRDADLRADVDVTRCAAAVRPPGFPFRTAAFRPGANAERATVLADSTSRSAQLLARAR
jgi:hypothetical protein